MVARFHFEDSGRPPDLLRLVDALNGEGVRYVVIGGMAMVLHGTTHVTVDSDLAIATDDENRAATARALAPLEPEPNHLPRGGRVVWDERSIEVELMGRRVRVASIPDVIAMKRVAGRAKDLVPIEELEDHERNA